MYSSLVIDMFVSDHAPVYIIKKMNTNKKKNHITFKGRTYRNYTSDILHHKIDNNLNLDRILELEDPTECWNKLYESLVAIADEIIPKKEYKIKKEKPAWLTDELLNLRNDRNYFFKKAKMTGDEVDWFVARNLRNRFNETMKGAKSEYINRLDPKDFTSNMRYFPRISQNSLKIPPHL